MENKRISELPIATVMNDEDYTVIVQNGINKRANRGIFKQKNYNDLNNRPYINSTFTSSLVPANEILQGTIQLHKISKTGKYGDLLDLPFIPVNLTDLTNDAYFVQDQYYVHTDNNLTDGLLDKINSAIQGIKVNNNLVTPSESQEVNIIVPVKLTDLTNDAYFVQDENYIHTDNNFTDVLKESYDNLVTNVNQPVNANNKIATINDIAAMDSGFWIPIDIYKTIVFDGVINIGGEIPTSGTYAVIEGEENILINKYVDGVSDNSNVPIRDGYFVYVKGKETEIIYYIKENAWQTLGTDLSDYYTGEQSDKKYVAKEEGKGLSSNDFTDEYKKKIDEISGPNNSTFTEKEKEKLEGISSGANKVEASSINGNIKIDGVETTVYTKPALTKKEVTDALGYTPPETNTTYSVVTTSKDGLMSSTMLNKLNGIAEGADNVSFSRSLSSGTKIGSININGTATDIYAPTNTDTHYTTHLYAGTSSGNANAATSNGNTYLMVADNTTVRDRRLIKGTGGTTVESDSNGNITINSPTSTGGGGIETIEDASFIGNWSYYNDGESLTETEGLSMETYDKMKPGVILEYTSPYSYNSTCSSLILYQNSSYSYKPEGGRYFIRNYVMVDSNGNLRTYTFSTDTLYGDENVYKGSALGEYSGGVACFTGDTLVNTEHGLQPIQSLKIGDKVYSRNIKKGIQLKEISKLFSHITNKIYEIDTGANIIQSSWSHPFYTENKGMIMAKDLRIGDIVKDIDNNSKIIKNITINSNPTKVFEIKVKDNNNYFVGKDNIFVGCERI